MLQAQENSKDDDAGDPRGVWSSKIFAAICIIVGASTLVLAIGRGIAATRSPNRLLVGEDDDDAGLRSRSS